MRQYARPSVVAPAAMRIFTAFWPAALIVM
jgi:hypothetical protein